MQNENSVRNEKQQQQQKNIISKNLHEVWQHKNGIKNSSKTD